MIKHSASTPCAAKPLFWLGSLLLAAALAVSPARGQQLDPVDLEELVAPIALYPDDLLGIILPAATFPLDIVRAARFLEELEQDPSLEPDPSWDDSIVALLNYPEVLRMMNEDLDWTWALGEAVLTDQTAVLAAAQEFRSRAYAAGNLRSDDKQIVGYSDGAIQIKPAQPDVVYIPVYEPREVVIYNAVPRYRYYPIAYPVYYYPYPAGYAFGIDYFWGVSSYFSIGWHSHYVHVLHHSHRSHPYYLNSYYLYRPYYPRTSVNITVAVDDYRDVWVPSPRRGSRPRTVTVESRSSSVRPRTVTTETQPNVTTRTSTFSSSSAARAAGAASTSRTRTTTSPSGRSTSSLGSASQRQSTISTESARAPASGSVTSSSSVGTQTRSVRTRNPTSTTRGSAITQPTTRPQVSAPAPRTSAPSRSRSTVTTQGSTRRATPAPAARAAAPTPRASAPAPSSSPATIGGARQAPSRNDSAGRTRR